MSIREIYNNVAGIPKDGKPRMGYEEFHQAIISAILEKMPKERKGRFVVGAQDTGNWVMTDEAEGFNSALPEMRERIKEI